MGVALTNNTLETSIEEIVEKAKKAATLVSKLLNMKNIIIATFFILYRSVKDKKETPKTMIVEASWQCQFERLCL
jgi:hypothetical protein